MANPILEEAFDCLNFDRNDCEQNSSCYWDEVVQDTETLLNERFTNLSYIESEIEKGLLDGKWVEDCDNCEVKRMWKRVTILNNDNNQVLGTADDIFTHAGAKGQARIKAIKSLNISQISGKCMNNTIPKEDIDAKKI